MFFAALCGTPAVSEARGSSGDQVKTAQASAAQRGNLSQSFFSYFVRKYGREAAKAIFYSGGSFGAAKFLKAGDLNTWARYLLNFKSTDLRNAEELMDQVKEKEKKLEEEKNLFEAGRAEAVKYNEKLVGDNNALDLRNKNLQKQAEENEKKIKELENSKAKLSNEVLSLKDHNYQLFNLTNEDNQKIDALLWSYLPVKIAGELDMFMDKSWRQNSYEAGKVRVEATPYSSNQGGGVMVVSAKYNVNGEMVGDTKWSTLKADELFGALAEKAGHGELVNVSLKNINLTYCGINCLARYSYSAGDDVLVFYFPVKDFQLINVKDNNDENNGNNEQNINNNVVNNENNENNENVNNEGNNK